MQSIDYLTREITALAPSEQEVLFDKSAQLNFQKGLDNLADTYPARLGRLNALRRASLGRASSHPRRDSRM